ncbi:MAG TPA: hypothetical protein VLX31_15630 [Streptosporangiaceae bacterium]|nr:hypothetical protein [Streptosporangiaceae bacterium]
MSQRRFFGRKLRWAVPVGAVVAVGGVLAGTMLASAAPPSLAHRTPAQLLAGMRQAKLPASMTAVVSESANLGLPALPNIGGLQVSGLSALSFLSGTHTVDIWYAGPRHVRIALPVSFGETDLRVNGDQVWLWDSQGQTATHYILPSRGSVAPRVPVPARHAASSKAAPDPFASLSPLQAADRLLALIGPTTRVTVSGTTLVAGRAAYELAIAPRSQQSLIARIVVDVAAKGYLPLRVQVFARGSASPSFSLGFTSLSLARPAMSNFTFTPPPGAHVKVVRLPSQLAAPSFGFPMIPSKPGGPRPEIRRLPGAQVPALGVRTLGSGWLTVLVLQASQASARGVPRSPVAAPVHGAARVRVLRIKPLQARRAVHRKGVAAQSVVGKNTGNNGGGFFNTGPPIPASPLLGVLLKATKAVHGRWGSGRLLRTSLISVLITSKGQVLIGAVTPAVLYADAAKVT